MLAVPALAAVAAVTPNFLFVLTDDMGWGDVSYNKEYLQPGAGGKNWTVNPPHTPNIDALALGENTMLFRRFYAGSAVCSPTRASILSGRTPMRSCIDNAEGCGQQPAWSCYDKMPFPPTEFTVAEAAKQKGYATMFVGKWHLGDFWNKGEKGGYALTKWPSSHPGMHGFDEWAGTEASAASCTTNCGCQPDWVNEGQGCIKGGGVWMRKAYECTNYWSPTDLDGKHAPTRPECHVTNTTTRDCVANLTSKIVGDDSQHMMDVFEGFLQRKSAKGSEPSKWLAQLSIHTNHEPHPALPEWYYAYNHTEGGPAGDYLGTISQMDHAIGRLTSMLKQYGHWDNTMVWYTQDNGAHTAGRPSGQLSASNGLRQCKASIFEGGIRVGGFIIWPQTIKQHKETLHAGCTTDFLPTVLDLLGVQHPHPNWASDGMSLAPLLRGDIPATSHRTKPIGFMQSGQTAWHNDTGAGGVWKIVLKPQKGQCETFLEPYGSMKDKNGPFLFNLTADPTESNDLCSKEKAICDSMKKAMYAFQDSVQHSREYESTCEQATAPAVEVTHPTTGFELRTSTGECLTLQGLRKHAVAVVGACDAGAKWVQRGDGSLSNVATPSWELKLDSTHGDGCSAGNTIWSSEGEGSNNERFHLDSRGRLVAGSCPGLCAVPSLTSEVIVFSSAAMALGTCDSFDVMTFSRHDQPAGGWPAFTGTPTWQGA